MQDINQRKSTDEYGEDISNVEKSLRQVGISLRDTQNSFKPLNQVLDETAKKWDSLTQLQQADVAKSIAGVRQRENFIVLMTHYNDALKLQGQMVDSSGSAMIRYGEYAKSTEAKLNDLTNAMQKLFMQFIHSETINSTVSGLTNFVNAISRVTSTIGGLNSLLLIVVPLISIRLLSSLYSTAAGAGLLETALVALDLGIEGLTASLTALLVNPVTWLIAAIGTIAVMIPIWINYQQKLKTQTEETTKAQNEFNKTIKEFQDTLDPQKINDAATALEHLKSAVHYDDTIEQIKQLEQEIDNLQNKVNKDKTLGSSTGDYTAFAQDNALLEGKKEKLAKLQSQLVTVNDAQKKYNEQVVVSVQHTQTEVEKYNKILDNLANGHKFTADEAKKLIAENGRLSEAFKINGDSAEVNKDAIVNLKNSAIDQAITAVNSSIAQTKTVVSNSIDRTKAFILEANSINSLIDVYNAIAEKANSVTGSSSDSGINIGVREQLEKSYAPLTDLYKNLDALNQLKSSASSVESGGFESTPSSKTKKSSSTPSVLDDLPALINGINAQSKLDEANNKAIQTNIDVAKSSKSYANQLKLTNDLLDGQKTRVNDLQEANNKLMALGDKIGAWGWVNDLGEATKEYYDTYDSSSETTQKQMDKEFNRLSSIKKAINSNTESIITLHAEINKTTTSLSQIGIDKYNQSISDIDTKIAQLKADQDLYNTSSEQYIKDQQQIIELQKQKGTLIDAESNRVKTDLSSGTLNPESTQLDKTHLSNLTLASPQNKKDQSDTFLTNVKSVYEIQQKQNDELQKSLDIQLQLTDAVSPKNYDQINVILGSQISLQQTNTSKIQESIASLTAYRNTLDQSSTKWKEVNDEISTMNTNLQSSLSTLSQTYKAQETNALNQQLSSIEQSIFGGQTESEASQALKNRTDYQNEYISGAEKAASVLRILNQVQQYNAELNNGIVDSQHQQITLTQSQLDLLNSSSDIKRSDLNLLEDQLKIQKDQASLQDEQNNKSIQQLTYDSSSGKWDYTYVTDQSKMLQLQGQLYQDQQDLAKTQIDNELNEQQTLLNQKSTYYNNLKTVVQNALNGEYTTTTQFQNAMASANSSFLNSLQGDNSSIWATINNTVSTNVSSMLTTYQNYVTQMEALQARLAAIMAYSYMQNVASTTKTSSSSSGSSSGSSSVVGTSTGPNGSNLVTVSTSTGTKTVLAGSTSDPRSSNYKGYADGGVNDYTGLAMVHGTKTSAETFFNATDSKKLWDFVHNLPSVAFGALNNINLPKMPSFIRNDQGGSTPQTFHIDNISFPNILDASGLEEAFNNLPLLAAQRAKMQYGQS